MKLSTKPAIQQFVTTLAALGLRKIVIAPGSRNAPLTISFNQHPAFECTSVRDERSAGFFALGKALESKEPVAILCSSGSAVLNFAPAIVEAFYLRVPLIVITADRPAEWIGQMDGQTMNQTDVYRNYIRKSYTIYGDTVSKNSLWHNSHSVNEGFAIATVVNPGPVHFNVPLEEPLFNTTEPAFWNPPTITVAPVQSSFAEKTIQSMQEVFCNAERVLILVGQNAPDEALSTILSELAAHPNAIVFFETTSNLHIPYGISHIDRCIVGLTESEYDALLPDLLITVGGAIVSKKIKELLRKNPPAVHWNIHPHDYLVNTYQCLTHAIPSNAESFFKSLLHNLPPVNNSSYQQNWLERAARMQASHDTFIRKMQYSDFFVFDAILKQIPKHVTVHFSNSSPIRYAQLFDYSHLFAVHCNRGTSGIDGCTSTAMGAASANPDKEYLLITGDVAFFYDNNALWNDSAPDNLKIILINNAGGGIFRIIQGPKETDELEEFFETKQTISAEKMVRFYGWEYDQIRDQEGLQTILPRFLQSGKGKGLLEIFTPNEVNSLVLEQYFNHLAQ